MYFLGLYWNLTLEEDLVHGGDGVLGGSGVVSFSPFLVGDLLPSGVSSHEWHGQPCACICFSGVLHLGDMNSFAFSSDAGFPLLFLRLDYLMWVRRWAWLFGEQQPLFTLSRQPNLGIFSVRPRLVAAWCCFVLEAGEFSSGPGGVVLFHPEL